MSVASFITDVLTFILIYAFTYIYAEEHKPLTELQMNTNIAEIASRDISYLGTYDSKLEVSMYRWIYSILVLLYQHSPDIDMKSIVIKWNDENNNDPDLIVYNSIEDAYTKLLSVLDRANELKTSPEFKISQEFDYHNYPSTFMYNDYIKPDVLVEIVDNILKGDN